MELRCLEDAELRAAPDGHIVGYAAVFNSLSHPLSGGYRERILPGAFARAIREQHDARALVNHNPSQLLGRIKVGTLRLREDVRGLHFEIDPPKTSIGADLLALLRRGDIDQSSFGFRIPEGGARMTRDGGQQIREVTDVDLLDISIVTYPGYEATEANVRSLLGVDGSLVIYGAAAQATATDSGEDDERNRAALIIRLEQILRK